MPTNTFAEDNDYYSTWEPQLSGKYKLIWFYNTREDSYARQPNRVVVSNKEFIINTDVRPPVVNSVYLMEYSKVNEGEAVLDIGTGSGLHAIFAAEKAQRVVATDIYKPAIENARSNAQLNGVADKIDFRVGDLFEPIGEHEKFDVFFVNINFPFHVNDDRRNALHERLFSEVHQYMKPNARIYFQTSFVKNVPYIYDMLNRNNLRITEMHMENMPEIEHEALFMLVQRH
ncbi:methyltransferase domain-containing protein [Kaarinaea lacus]